MTKEDVATLFNQLLLTAQKMKSNIEDTGVSESTALYLYPELFRQDGMDIISIFLAYSNKANSDFGAEPIDVYNALIVAHKYPQIYIGYSLRWGGKDLPDPKKAMVEYMMGL